MAEKIAETEQGRALQARLSPGRWSRVVAEAEARAEVFDAVVAHQSRSGSTWRGAVAAVATETPWPTFVNWNRRFGQRDGPTWERLLDERWPPPNARVGDAIRFAAITLRYTDRSMSTEVARGHLRVQFGDAGEIGDASLKRVWAAAGVRYVAGTGGKTAKPATPTETVAGSTASTSGDGEEIAYFPGGGLALIAAAEAELDCVLDLAKCVLRVGGARAVVQEVGTELIDDAADRGEHGTFTREYNERRRGATPAGQTDGRWASDAAKAAQRPLATLSVLARRPETLARKMLSMGVNPLLSERRGFNGLEGHQGAWLSLLGGVAYMPATLDKVLTELALLDVDAALWQKHATAWAGQRQMPHGNAVRCSRLAVHAWAYALTRLGQAVPEWETKRPEVALSPLLAEFAEFRLTGTPAARRKTSIPVNNPIDLWS